jgi:hypothetical protein
MFQDICRLCGTAYVCEYRVKEIDSFRLPLVLTPLKFLAIGNHTLHTCGKQSVSHDSLDMIQCVCMSTFTCMGDLPIDCSERDMCTVYEHHDPNAVWHHYTYR